MFVYENPLKYDARKRWEIDFFFKFEILGTDID